MSFLTDTVDKILRIDENDKKADMQPSSKVAAFGVAMVLPGLFLTVISICYAAWFMLSFAALAFCASAVSFVCYKFGRIRILSDAVFEYTTLLGTKKVSKFEDIRAIRTDSDSHVLILNRGKIRIYANSTLSEKLKSLLNKELDRIYKENSAKRIHHKLKNPTGSALNRRKDENNN